MHVTIALERTDFSFGTLLMDMVKESPMGDDELVKSISSVSSTTKALHQQIPIPILEVLSKSIDNEDLPDDFISKDIDQELNAISQSIDSISITGAKEEIKVVSSFISSVRSHPEMIGNLVNLIRQKLGMARLQPLRDCPGSVGLSGVNMERAQFRRKPGQSILFASIPGMGNILVAGETQEDQHLFGGDRAGMVDAVRYSLSTYAKGSSQGTFFTLQELQLHGHLVSKEAAVKVVQDLLNYCVLEIKAEWLWKRNM